MVTPEKVVPRYQPPTEYELHDTFRNLFIEAGEEITRERDEYKDGEGLFWHRTILTFADKERMSIANADNGVIAVRAQRQDLFFQFGLDEDGLAWIEGVIRQEEDWTEDDDIYIKEFFDEGHDELLEALYDWTSKCISREKVSDPPDFAFGVSVLDYKKNKNWVRHRL